MRPPLQHLPDATLWHYRLQLNVYRRILEKYYGVVVWSMYIVGCRPDNLGRSLVWIWCHWWSRMSTEEEDQPADVSFQVAQATRFGHKVCRGRQALPYIISFCKVPLGSPRRIKPRHKARPLRNKVMPWFFDVFQLASQKLRKIENCLPNWQRISNFCRQQNSNGKDRGTER